MEWLILSSKMTQKVSVFVRKQQTSCWIAPDRGNPCKLGIQGWPEEGAGPTWSVCNGALSSERLPSKFSQWSTQTFRCKSCWVCLCPSLLQDRFLQSCRCCYAKHAELFCVCWSVNKMKSQHMYEFQANRQAAGVQLLMTSSQSSVFSLLCGEGWKQTAHSPQSRKKWKKGHAPKLSQFLRLRNTDQILLVICWAFRCFFSCNVGAKGDLSILSAPHLEIFLSWTSCINACPVLRMFDQVLQTFDWNRRFLNGHEGDKVSSEDGRECDSCDPVTRQEEPGRGSGRRSRVSCNHSLPFKELRPLSDALNLTVISRGSYEPWLTK